MFAAIANHLRLTDPGQAPDRRFQQAAAGTFTAMAAAPGRAAGPARVVRDPACARIEPGEILVTPTTDPGWTPLFLTARGLVTEIGAPLAHGPTVAREYGIPTVIGVHDATRKIQTGQIITVDGTAGTVTIEDDPHEPGLIDPRALRFDASTARDRREGVVDFHGLWLAARRRVRTFGS